MEKDQQLPASGETVWNWKRLIIELAKRDVFEPGGLMHKGVPPGLRDRRRLWRMLSELGKPVCAVAASNQAGASSDAVTTITQAGACVNSVAARTQAEEATNDGEAS